MIQYNPDKLWHSLTCALSMYRPYTCTVLIQVLHDYNYGIFKRDTYDVYDIDKEKNSFKKKTQYTLVIH